MLSYERALEKIQNIAEMRVLDTEEILLADSFHRVLGQNLFSPENVPGFDNSAMDGFAVVAEDTLNASLKMPLILELLGTVGAGESFKLMKPEGAIPNKNQENNKKHTCIEIMTGAPVPFPYNAVIKIEEVMPLEHDQTGQISIKIPRPVRLGENIRKTGEDYLHGAPLLTQSTVLMPEHIMALATLGQKKVPVFKKPKVVIISTGKELVDYNCPSLQTSQIRNSTAIYLSMFLQQMACEVEITANIPDDPAEFFKLFKQIEENKPDLIITTGAVSMGKYDFIKSCLGDLEADIVFHKVAIRPGKPLLFAQSKGGAAIFGLPGNPISTAVGARFFIAPYLKKITRQMSEKPLRAKLTKEVKKPTGLRCFYKASVNFSNHTALCLPGQESFRISPFTQANCWIVLPEEGETILQNSEVDIYPLSPLSHNSNPHLGEKND